MNRRNLLFALIVLTSSAAFSQTALPSSKTVLNDALAQAAKYHKKVMLIFHASWCGWCRKMEASINDSTCKKKFDDNYVIAWLDVLENAGGENLENSGSLDALKKYNNGEISGLPFWLVIDAKGNVLANSVMKSDSAAVANPDDNVGCPAAEKEVAYFTKVLKSTSKLKDEDLAVIYKRFLANKAQR